MSFKSVCSGSGLLTLKKIDLMSENWVFIFITFLYFHHFQDGLQHKTSKMIETQKEQLNEQSSSKKPVKTF